MFIFNEFFLLIIAALLLPIGGMVIATAIWWKSEKAVILGSFLVLISIIPFVIMSPFFLWFFDWARGWDLRLGVEIDDYTVTLVQEPGSDFYESYFEFENHEGQTARVLLDADDSRWWNPGIVREDGKIYFTRGQGQIGDDLSP